MGYSFAAGTTDGPGAFDFKQNNSKTPNANPVWAVVGGFLHKPSDEQKSCHYPKPILLDVGEVERPYLWTPNIVDIQMLRVGQFVMIISPGEATTMAGRRWKEAIKKGADQTKLTKYDDDTMVVLGGPANSYTHYIATEEEYNIQRYEGASTLYGPHTLNAYIALTSLHLHYLQSDTKETPRPGPPPPININNSLSFIRGVVFDGTPIFKSFGDVVTDASRAYNLAPGTVVEATFVGANPRNDLKLEKTFAAVERKLGITSWEQIKDDSDWSLIFRWKRTNSVLGISEVTIQWEVEDDVERKFYLVSFESVLILR